MVRPRVVFGGGVDSACDAMRCWYNLLTSNWQWTEWGAGAQRGMRCARLGIVGAGYVLVLLGGEVAHDSQGGQDLWVTATPDMHNVNVRTSAFP